MLMLNHSLSGVNTSMRKENVVRGREYAFEDYDEQVGNVMNKQFPSFYNLAPCPLQEEYRLGKAVKLPVPFFFPSEVEI